MAIRSPENHRAKDSLVWSFLFGLVGFPAGLASVFLISWVPVHLGTESITFGFILQVLSWLVPAFLLFVLIPLSLWRDQLTVLIGGSLSSCLGFGAACVSSLTLIELWARGEVPPSILAILLATLVGSYLMCVWGGSRVYRVLRQPK